MKKLLFLFLVILLSLALFACGDVEQTGDTVTTEDVTTSTVVTTEPPTFPLTHDILPELSYLGRVFTAYNAGPGLVSDQNGTTDEDSYVKVIPSTTAEKLLAYTKILEENGYRSVATTEVDGDVYYTYEKYGKLFYFYYNQKLGETRVIVDNSSVELSKIVPQYTPKAEDTVAFYQYSLNYRYADKEGFDPVVYTESVSQDSGMSYVLKLADNSVVVIDGGGSKQSTVKSRQGFLDFLRSITETPEGEKVRIATWIFTHAHGDHMVFANEFLREQYQQIELLGMAYNFPSYQVLGSGYAGTVFEIKGTLEERYPDVLYHKLHTGEVLDMAGITIEVVYTHEDAINRLGVSKIGDFNSTSTVMKITIGGKSIMILGDIGGAAQEVIVAMHSAEYLKCDAVQASHHGFNSLNTLYPLINAPIALFPQSAFCLKDPENSRGNLKEYQEVMTYSSEEYFAHKYTYEFTVQNGEFVIRALPRYDAQ